MNDINEVVAIQVQTTKLSGAGVEVVPYKTDLATHWSLYLRERSGETRWVKDICVHRDGPSLHFGAAMVEAAKLSMQYGVRIEQVI
jgi:hypothetical protein